MCTHVLIFGVWIALNPAAEQNAGPNHGASRPPDQVSQRQTAQRRNAFRMSTAVVCKSIDGYESYTKLPGASLTSDEKLLVYYRPLGFKTAVVDGNEQAHLIQDGQIRKRGEKAVLRQKLKLLDCKATTELPNVYLRNTVSLKGLAPGDYDFIITLHDEIAKGQPITQIVRFRIVAADIAGEAARQDQAPGDDPSDEKKEKVDPSPRGGRAGRDVDSD